jgi:hypothetical protein
MGNLVRWRGFRRGEQSKQANSGFSAGFVFRPKHKTDFVRSTNPEAYFVVKSIGQSQVPAHD